MKYFVFCQSDLVLEKVGDGYQIPEEAPTATKPWTTVMDIDGAKAYRIDAPLTANPSPLPSHHYEMCGLRQSYYKLSEADYRLAGKCHELLYWDQNTKFCGVCGGTMRFDTAISKKCEHCGKEIWPFLAPAELPRRPLRTGGRFRRDWRDAGGGCLSRGNGRDGPAHHQSEVFRQSALALPLRPDGGLHR